MPSIALAPSRRALVDDDDLDVDALRAQPLGLLLDARRPRRGTSRPAVLPAATSSGVLWTVAPITPTLTPLTLKTVDGLT